ncbi:GvpL/GvpF family gas vesicle protein [Streptomyces sp. CBMA123]|uniref:GvpL/GvpF family gas vesicle protein n=1 Tax=Streptomyces sp. CBMA123 TaxID=1896313 RepID=UPI001661E031|nr:GvpL/GvpF family gas vesicle protein [Streptomyces sp. CBMA123]MBD0694758.1 gas vesicle protein [Streptomyces sp. CBMA123]
MTSGSLTYAYAVARDCALLHASGAITGIAGAPVGLVPPDQNADQNAGLVAAVSPVPENDFHETALREHLEDLGWLETLARAHHSVIEELAARTTVLPLRLATVYLDEDRVRAMLRERQALFLDRLEHLAGHVEMGVKLYVDLAHETAAAPTPSPEQPLSPGRAYLHHRRAEQDSRDDARRAAEQAAERIATIARDHAVERARHHIQEGELATGPGANVSNDAYLVPTAHVPAFRAELTRATDGLTGVRVDVTGPWAPYSFATLPDPGGSSS